MGGIPANTWNPQMNWSQYGYPYPQFQPVPPPTIPSVSPPPPPQPSVQPSSHKEMVKEVLSSVSTLMPDMMKEMFTQMGFGKSSKDATGPPVAKKRRLAEDDKEEEEETAEVEEEEDDDARSADSYREKLILVCTIEGLETVTTTTSDPGSLSVEPVTKKAKITLPASVGFMQNFTKFSCKLAGTPVKEGGEVKAALAVGKFPKLFTPKATYYSIPECPWKTGALPLGSNLIATEEKIFPDTKVPDLVIPDKECTALESSERLSLNLHSYLDHFIAASKKQLKNSVSSLDSFLKEQTELDVDTFYEMSQSMKDVLRILDSAALANQDLSKVVCDRISFLVTTRRDAFIGKMAQLPLIEKTRLRSLPVNTPSLFPPEEIEKAREKIKASREQEKDYYIVETMKNQKKFKTNFNSKYLL